MTHQVCLFAHYDPSGEIGPHTRHYLLQLQDCGFEIHIAYSGHTEIKEETAQYCRETGLNLYPRPNEGLDFGAWQHLIASGCTNDADTILFANDSVFGPLEPLKPIIDLLRRTDPDVWGMVASNTVNWHIQSWFIGMNAKAFNSDAVQRIFSLPFSKMSRAGIILHGEIGLGIAIQEEGLTTASVWQDDRKGLRRAIAINPTHTDWHTLATRGGVPFIKVELLRDNPSGVFWVGEWRKLVSKSSCFSENWIDQWLAEHPPRSRMRKASLRMRMLYALISLDKRLMLRHFFKK